MQDDLNLIELLDRARAITCPPLPSIGPLDHIGIKVTHLDAALKQAALLRLQCIRVGVHASVGLRVAFLQGWQVPVEFLEVCNSQSPIAHHQDGLHHIAFRTSGLQEDIRHAQEYPRFQTDGIIRRGGEGHDISIFSDLHQPDVLFELVAKD